MAMVPVILAGGAGERLWPLSRAGYPKQFIDLDGSGISLFQATLARVADGQRFAPPVMIAHRDHRFLLAEQARLAAVAPSAILLEPVAKNTAASVLLAALQVTKTQADALLLVLPSDHQIRDEAAFIAALADASGAAKHGHIVTFSITPSGPETGYGYIRRGAPLPDYFTLQRMAGFIEKPTRERAQALIDAGNCGFNSGMFLARADVLIAEFTRHAPEIYAACAAALSAAKTEGDFTHLDEDAFAACPALPFDIAVMERTDKGAVLPVSMGWSDVGSWHAVDALAEKTAQGNACVGHVHLHGATNCYIHSDKPLIAALGVRDLVIVACEDAVLVADKSQIDGLKGLLAALRAANAYNILPDKL